LTVIKASKRQPRIVSSFVLAIPRTGSHGGVLEAKTMAHVLAAGTSSPSFTLRVTPDQYLSLADLSSAKY
jgi:hypothetical protein